MKNTNFSVISKLAMIEMSEDEMRAFEDDALRITKMADALAALDLDAKDQIGCISLDELRKDTPVPYPKTQKLVDLAPSKEGAYIVAPKTFTQE